MADSIHEILAEAGIDTSRLRLRAGSNEKVVCPRCNGGKHRDKCLSITVSPDGMGVKWKCHLVSCSPGFQGGGVVGRDRDVPAIRRPAYRPAKTHENPQKPQAMYDFWLRRGITHRTVDAYGVFVTRVFFPQVEEARDAMALPYTHDGVVVGHKYRGFDKLFAQDPQTQPVLFGADQVTSFEAVALVEGEADVLAMREAGYQAVSLRDGAPQTVREDGDPRIGTDKRFAAFEAHPELMRKVKRWLIAPDMDPGGNNLAAEAIRRLGAKRCWRVSWPDGCKDANDTLKQFVTPGALATQDQVEMGRKAVRKAVEAAEACPLLGLVQPTAEDMLEYRQNGRVMQGYETGIGALDAVLKMPIEGGRLIIVTGPPNHGKSPFVRQVMVRLAAFHGAKAVFAAPEEGSSNVLMEMLVQCRSGMPFWPGPTPHMGDEDLAEAVNWVRKHFAFIQSDDPDEPLTIEHALEMAEAAKLRIGANYLVLDPWNEFETLCKSGESETQMVSRVLRTLKAWGRSQGFDIIIVAHPQKPPNEDRKNPRPPTGYDVSGSHNFYAKADIGVTVWRPDSTETSEIIVWKSKSATWARRGSKALLSYDIVTGRYRSAEDVHDDIRVPQEYPF